MQNTNTLPDIIIRSEADAYDILDRASRDEIPPYGSIKFEGWPTFSLYLKGKKFDHSLTPTIMKALIEFQRGLYRSYSVASFNDANKRLTDDEKDDLEVKVTVNSGSTDLGIDFQEIAVKMVEQFGAKMSGTEILIGVVLIATMYFGKSAWTSYLESQREIKAKEIGDETQRATLDALKFTSEQETKRAQIIANLAEKDGRVSTVQDIAFDTYTEVVRSLASAESARIEGNHLTPDVADFLTRNVRRSSFETRLDGKYRLMKLDWSDQTAFRVKVFNVVTGLQLDALVQDDSMTGKYKEALRNAEWNRQPVNLRITARKIGEDSYRDAVIVFAELDDPAA